VDMDMEVAKISSGMLEMERKLSKADTPKSELIELAGRVKGEIQGIEMGLGRLKFGKK